MADILDDVFTRLQALAVIPDTARQQVEQQLRADWGGTSPYIRRHVRDARGRPSASRPDLAPEQRQQVLEQQLRGGVPLPQAFAAAGLPRSSGFRFLKRRSF